MGARVFISCGQATESERKVAAEVSDWFITQGYTPYVAVSVQTILDLNSGIIGALKEADFYLFINFKRELIINTSSASGLLKSVFSHRKYRGSLYTQQELAVGYALGFQNMILINERDCLVEGILKFIVTNAPPFVHTSEILPGVQAAVGKAGWAPIHRRQLAASSVQFVGPSYYRDHSMQQPAWRLFLHGLTSNGRPDIAARHTVCRLNQVKTIDGTVIAHGDHSPLKAVNVSSYEQMIWPQDEGKFDLLSIDAALGTHVYLHSTKDLYPRQPIITSTGTYLLNYAILAEGFMPISFWVQLTITGDSNTATAALVTSGS